MKKRSAGMLADCNKIIRFKYRNEIPNKYFIRYNILRLFCLLGLFVCFVLFLVFILLKKNRRKYFWELFIPISSVHIDVHVSFLFTPV